MPDIAIRHATSADRDALRALQEASMRELGRSHYDDDVIDAFVDHVGTMDDSLIGDGTYFAAFWRGRLAGCGGWTLRRPGYMAHSAEPEYTTRRIATVRSIFVHPSLTRRGIASRVMATIESEIARAGLSRATLGATLNGIPFYRQIGYRGGTPIVLRMPGELLFVAMGMEKPIARGASEASAA